MWNLIVVGEREMRGRRGRGRKRERENSHFNRNHNQHHYKHGTFLNEISVSSQRLAILASVASLILRCFSILLAQSTTSRIRCYHCWQSQLLYRETSVVKMEVELLTK
jgi:hypothetical protein